MGAHVKLCLFERLQAHRGIYIPASVYRRVVGWLLVWSSGIAKNSQVCEIVVGLDPCIG